MPLSAAVLALLLGGVSATAAEDQTLDATRVEAAIPGLKVHSVKPVPISGGLYEVVDEQGNVLYLDGAAKIVFQANLFDVATRRNLTEDSVAHFKAVEFDTLPLEYAIKRIKGKGTRRLAVFSDPDCPFCAELEKTLRAVDDVTVYTFLYPIANLHPDADERARRIWCAPDRDAAWLAWVIEQRDPPAPATDCESPVGKIAEIAPRFRVSGTPSLVFGSGRVASGTLAQSRLEEFLSEAPLNRASATATADAALR
jgi:thiol:disulfide interchange protein DsbC